VGGKIFPYTIILKKKRGEQPGAAFYEAKKKKGGDLFPSNQLEPGLSEGKKDEVHPGGKKKKGKWG